MHHVFFRSIAASGSLASLMPLALMAGASLPASEARAATVPVVNCRDSGAGSLRGAVASARSGDTIDLTKLGCRKIVLTSGPIDIPQQYLSLIGSGRANTVLDGNNAGSVLMHGREGMGPGTLVVKSMTLANGNGRCVVSMGNLDLISSDVHHCSGGGAFADLHLRLIDSRLYSNHAPGEYGYGGGAAARSLRAVSSQVWNNSATEGGGLWSATDASLSYSSVSQNRSVGAGGGVYAIGNLLVNKSTISTNRATGVDSGHGGGARGNEVAVYDSTFSGNVANYASAVFARGSVEIANSTIVENRETQAVPPTAGAVFVYSLSGDYFPPPTPIGDRGPYTINSSIIARNQANGMPGNDLGPYYWVAGANNIIERATILLPADTLSANPLLDPLADNGGPTKTHALRSASPAIDRGNNRRNRQYDQRGPDFMRIKGVAPDIGAFER
jgi:hypothetical protein